MVQKTPLPHLAQHYAKKNQQLSTKQVLILPLEAIVDDRLGMGKFPSSDVCQMESPKLRLLISINALVRGVIANANHHQCLELAWVQGDRTRHRGALTLSWTTA